MTYRLEKIVKAAIGFGMLGAIELAYVGSKPDEMAPYIVGAILISGALAIIDADQSLKDFKQKSYSLIPLGA